MSHPSPSPKLVLTAHLALLVCISLITGCGSGGAIATSSPGNPQQPSIPTVSISSDKATVIAGDTATLSWNSTSATTLNIDNGIGAVPPSGSRDVQPTADTTYTITASGAGGTATAAVTIKFSDTRSPVKHAVVVIMQNRSFDHLFGKLPGANGAKPGDPGFVQKDAAGTDQTPFLLTQLNRIDLVHAHSDFVKMVDSGKMDGFALVNGATAMGFYDNTTPGIDVLWNLAQQFALADNFFASVLGDAPTNQLYLVAASDRDFPFGVEPAFGPCNEADPASTPYTFPNLADQLSAKNLAWGWFAENYGICTSYQENQNSFQFFTSTHDSPSIQDFSQFKTRLANGTLPPVSFIQPTDPHAMHPSSALDVAAGTQWLTQLVQDIQNSSVWADTAIIVVWDSAGGWYDHVAPTTVDSQGMGPRVPMLVISPFGKRNYISHVPMDDVSILRFIQWNWGLPSLNPRNDSPASGDLRDMFQF
jgi:phospholipase C